MSGLLDLDEAQERLLALVPVLGAETVPVEEALGRVLAHDLKAARTQPSADLSAMDGYALSGAGPWKLVGESRAGAPFDGKLAEGEAVRISTGAHMPAGSDSVLIQENAHVTQDEVSAEDAPPLGKHVRKRGFDFASGDTVLEAGTRIGPAQLALAITSGHGTLAVRKRAKVAVLDSGDELSSDPENCGPNQIPASNGAMIAAMLRPLVGECMRIGPVGDDMGALAAALARAEGCDILITSGGASVGDHDLVQSALREWGADIAFWKVAIRPGKPLMVATRGSQVVLGLPGNPVSSFVTAFLFALPLARAAMGMAARLPVAVTAQAAETMPATGARREFVRGVFDGQRVRRAASQDSSAIRSLAAANCLIERPAGSGEVQPGEPVRIYNIENG
ncbi:molybdopterin molybdenumtransferase MoeA [Erythrobacter sp. KY5]|uniref:molybdopterin molybdotransferase MoeA n=1 Tax=Erythrobacter sp. KY5 TaxID=2011159 RepID=UPI000DBF2E88|nr:molybdopterin molybdotransferase MoeA [Erythrobacter sp. KY5]AWW74839.1 molybdopterin molybdenumtransferase MoeA [Erythrobacter sp. KY5]